MTEAKPLAQRQDDKNEATVFKMMRLPEMTNRLTDLLPAGERPDHFTAQIVSFIKQNPALMECEPVSLLQCTVRAAVYGFAPDPVTQLCHFIPRFNKKLGCSEATFQVGYQGMRRLAERGGKVKTIRAYMIHKNDKYDVRLGGNPGIDHHPLIPGDRGPEIACYAVAQMADGSQEFEVMSIEELDEFQKQFAATDSDYGPWKKTPNEMRKKTLVKRLAKQLPLSNRDLRLVMADEYREAGVNDGMGEYDIDVTPTKAPAAPDRQPGETAAQAKIRAAAAQAQAAPATAEQSTEPASAPAPEPTPPPAASAGTGPRRGRKPAAEKAESVATEAAPASNDGYTGAKITQAQADQLIAEIKEREIPKVEVDEQKKKLGIATIFDLPANRFTEMRQWIHTGGM